MSGHGKKPKQIDASDQQLVKTVEEALYGKMNGHVRVYPSTVTPAGCCAPFSFKFEVVDEDLKLLYEGTATNDIKKPCPLCFAPKMWRAEIPEKNWTATTELWNHSCLCPNGHEAFIYGTADNKKVVEVNLDAGQNLGYLVRDGPNKDSREVYFRLLKPHNPLPIGCCALLCPPKEEKEKSGGGKCCSTDDTITIHATYDPVAAVETLKAATEGLHGMNLYQTVDGLRDDDKPYGYFDWSMLFKTDCCGKTVSLERKECAGALADRQGSARNVAISFSGSGGSETVTENDKDLILGMAVRDAIRMVGSNVLVHPLGGLPKLIPYEMK